MEQSILKTVKKIIGIVEDDTTFDPDLIMYINGALSTLRQINAGPEEGFMITGSDETWDEFVSDSSIQNEIKEYVTLRTRLSFDPPTNSSAMEEIKARVSELEWRINTDVDDWSVSDE